MLHASTLLDRDKHLNLIVCTGSGHDKDKQAASELGYLLKPPAFEPFKSMVAPIDGIELRALASGQHQLLRVSA